MLIFPLNTNQVTNKKAREYLDKKEAKKRDNFQASIIASVSNTIIPDVNPLTLSVFPISQKNSEYSNLPYGKIGTIAEAGCGPLALEYAYRLLGNHLAFPEIVDMCVQNGYRAYIFDDDGNIIDGAGTEYALFDNAAYELNNLWQIFYYLERLCPITILVENAIYLGDSTKKGNHFVTLIGIKNGNALIMDGNKYLMNPLQAFVKVPFTEVAKSFRGAWAWV